MELRHLRTFLAVADTLNISEVARRLNVTQPALSRQIRELERDVGHPLFLRGPKGLGLTESGAVLHADASRAIAALDQALKASRGAGEGKAQFLNVGYYSNVCVWANILGPAFERLGRKYPKTTTGLTESTSMRLLEQVSKGELDMALLGPGEYPKAPGVEIALACTVPAVAMVPANHRLAKKRQIGIEDLRDEVIVGFKQELEPSRNRALLAACSAAGFRPKTADVASGVPELMLEVKKRMGVAVLDSFARVAPLPGMALLKFKPPGLSLDIYAAYSKQAAPAVSLLVELASAEARRAATLV